MKIIVGGLYHESNTFNPFLTDTSEFVFVEGEKMLERVASTKVFKDLGVHVIPSIYAFGLSSGIVAEETYRYYADKILDVIKKEDDIDGIWLHLHGSMTVENVGSGELQLLKEMRDIVGFETPISLTLDIHANNSIELTKYANIIRSYRTVPHIDQEETEIITAKLLFNSIRNNKKTTPIFYRLPLIIGGDTAVGEKEPLKSIFSKIEDIEALDGILTASFFIGFSWADTENTASSIIIIPESEEYIELAEKKAEELAQYIYSQRNKFEFSGLALDPKEAIEFAINSEIKPIFISDTGDNTTGGGVGVNTTLLKILLNHKNLKGKKVCIASILDKESYEKVKGYKNGEEVKVNVGVGYDQNSQSVFIDGIMKAKGDLLGYLGAANDKVGETCTISIGDLDIVLANKGNSFITLSHFIAAGLDIDEYDIIIVKQGYLFDELNKVARLAIFALSPGATYQHFNALSFEKIPRPLFPFDDVKFEDSIVRV